MPTNPLGADSVNFNVCMPKAERQFLGQLAFNEDPGQSLGEFLRKLWAKALADANPEAAAQLTEIRKAHRAKALGITMSVVGTVLVVSQLFLGGDIQRAQRTARRGRRQEQEFFQEA